MVPGAGGGGGKLESLTGTRAGAGAGVGAGAGFAPGTGTGTGAGGGLAAGGVVSFAGEAAAAALVPGALGLLRKYSSVAGCRFPAAQQIKTTSVR